MEKLLVFIPAYNCEKQVPRVLTQLLDPRVAPWVGACIVVNNRSADGTEAAVQDWRRRHPEAPVHLLRNDQNYGLGGSHKVAFGYAAAHGYEHLVVLHGDDQGAIADLLPILESGAYKQYDCCLGSRFMKGSRIKGYSALRVVGNHGFNGYYKKFPDTLYFNDCMILALCQMKQKVLFFPISWREEDQVSNNKFTSFGVSLLKLCGRYLRSPKAFVTREWRSKIIDDYTYTEIPVQQ